MYIEYNVYVCVIHRCIKRKKEKKEERKKKVVYTTNTVSKE